MNVMHSLRAALLGSFLVILAVPAGWTQTVTESPKPHLLSEYGLPGLDKKISLDLLDSMDVADLLKFLATKANLNIIIGREVSGAAKLMIKDVTLGEVSVFLEAELRG